MKKALYVALLVILAGVAAAFAMLYYTAQRPGQEYYLHSRNRQWLMSGDRRLFEVTERAFEMIGVFGFAEGMAKWVPVGGKTKSEFRATVVPRDVVSGIAGDEYVIGVVSNGLPTAYPLRVVAFHQVVNDDKQTPAVVVYFGNHSYTAAAFSAGAGDAATSLASTGCLYKNVDLLFDSRTESLFLPPAATFVAGERLGERLPVLPCAVLTLDDWTKMYPQTRVMTLSAGITSVKYPRRDILSEPVVFKVPLKAETRARFDNAEPVICLSDGWLTMGVPFAAAGRAAKRDVPLKFEGAGYTAHFAEDYKSAWITDSSGALAPSIRSTYRPYVSVMREAVIADVK